jgi:glycosyltransferase involved in cell wall biosynthesis
MAPFTRGGARNIVDWLAVELRRAGHEVDVVALPFNDSPWLLMDQLAAYRWLEIEGADRIICFRPPAHTVRHDHKVLWFIHHLRFYYDLWDTPYRGFPDDAWHRSLRDALHTIDTAAIGEATSVFANSHAVAKRLRDFNGVEAEVLFPPIFEPERYRSSGYGDEIVYLSRLEHHKRQHLAIEAMRHVQSDVRLRIVGAGSNGGYVDSLAERISANGLEDRVTLERDWISDERKIELFASALGVAYLPFDEDSYGYPTLEAFHSQRPVVTTSDSGGVLEIVEHERTGLVAEPSAASLANAFDRLHADRALAARLGSAGAQAILERNISWAHTIERLLA